MRPGPKAALPAEKKARGTYRNDRDGGSMTIVEPTALPSQPDWLTPAGEEVWQDDVGRVANGSLVTERDSNAFANYCNLQGAIVMAWRANEVPPAAHLKEARLLAEMFGLAGAKSRVTKGVPDAGKNSNPFARNGGRGARVGA